MSRSFMTSLFRASLFLIAAASICAAQPDRRSASPQPFLSSVTFEAVPLFSADTTSAVVHVHYRIRQDFFIILRNTDPAADASYVGKGELIVELKDKNNNSAAREFRAIIIKRNAPRSDNDQPADIQGAFTLRVPPGTYALWFSLDDAQSERSFVNHERTVVAKNPSTTGLDVSSPVFVVPSPNTDTNMTFDVLNHGEAPLFGERGGYLFNVFLPTDTALTVRYHLSNQTEYKVLAPQEFRGDSLIVMKGIATLQKPSGDDSFAATFPIRYVRSDAPDGWKVVYIPLPLEKLSPGEATIKLEFTSGATTRHCEYAFRTLWPRRPLSLSNLEFAVEALQHIATEEEMEEFRTLSDARFIEAFFRFWKKRDRDTATAYNEVMAEYYRRVDMANQRYSSTREVDGYKSDQGRIFILYGTPTNTERVFSPSGPPREVWTYAQLKKRFIFEDERRSGVYILAQVESL